MGTAFTINGEITLPGSRAEGMLLNSRMVQATFDDENPETIIKWAYPDTGVWDPERNTSEMIAALPSMANTGLNAITVNLQGGNPIPGPGQGHQPWINTAFDSKGELKSTYLSRLDRVIRAADQQGIVVIVGFFYFGQDHRISDESAVIRAVDDATNWLVDQGYTNVVVEIANESNVRYDHAILGPGRVPELINRVKDRSDLLVSTSFGGGFIPGDRVIAASDFILVHGNNQSPADITAMVATIRESPAYVAQPKPIVFNEDSTSIDNMNAAIEAGTSWGYFDKGENNYRDGFQAPPVNWTINTPEKVAFFDAVMDAAR